MSVSLASEYEYTGSNWDDPLCIHARACFKERGLRIRDGKRAKPAGRPPILGERDAAKYLPPLAHVSQPDAQPMQERAPNQGVPAPKAQAPALLLQPRAMRDFVGIANEYIDDVLTGKVPACLYVRNACQRQRDDLARLADHPVFYFDNDAATRVCAFIERMPHVKGPKASANEDITLEPWQIFLLTCVFGWKRKDTGGRRYRRSYVEVPRGNGKSALSSAVGLYCMTYDNEYGAEVYSAATTRDQAKIVFGDAQTMMRKRGNVRDALRIVVSTSPHGSLLLQPETNSKFEPLSREAGTMDGKNVHCAVIDELHAHKTREVLDVIETATAKRFSSLIWIITTAGSDSSGICYEVRNYVAKILEKNAEDDSQFGVIYTIDEGDDWRDPEIWRKANPNWGVSVMPDAFASLATKAMQTPAAQNNFKTKYLDQWVSADAAWMDLAAFDRCADPTLTEEQFRGMHCTLGLDLASKVDLACKAKLFWRDLPGDDAKMHRHYYLFCESYLPEQAIRDGRNASYEGWDLEQRIITTPGDVLDFAVVKEGLLADRNAYRVTHCGYDPWQATQLAQEMLAEGVPMVEVRATVNNFSAPMKELDALVRGGFLHHDGNPVLRWMFSNVIAHTDAKENIYPRKERAENKIDGVVATIMALHLAMVGGESTVDDTTGYNAERGFLTL